MERLKGCTGYHQQKNCAITLTKGQYLFSLPFTWLCKSVKMRLNYVATCFSQRGALKAKHISRPKRKEVVGHWGGVQYTALAHFLGPVDCSLLNFRAILDTFRPSLTIVVIIFDITALIVSV